MLEKTTHSPGHIVKSIKNVYGCQLSWSNGGRNADQDKETGDVMPLKNAVIFRPSLHGTITMLHSKPGSLLTSLLANQDTMSKLPTFDGSGILFQGMGEDIIKGILKC